MRLPRDARVLATERDDRARRAITYRAALSRVEARVERLEALAATDILGRDPVAYGALLTGLVDHPEAMQRAAAAAVRLHPELGETALRGPLEPLTSRERALIAETRADVFAALAGADDLVASRDAPTMNTEPEMRVTLSRGQVDEFLTALRADAQAHSDAEIEAAGVEFVLSALPGLGWQLEVRSGPHRVEVGDVRVTLSHWRVAR